MLMGNMDYGGLGMFKLLFVFVDEMMYVVNSLFNLYVVFLFGVSMVLDVYGNEFFK